MNRKVIKRGTSAKLEYIVIIDKKNSKNSRQVNKNSANSQELVRNIATTTNFKELNPKIQPKCKPRSKYKSHNQAAWNELGVQLKNSQHSTSNRSWKPPYHVSKTQRKNTTLKSHLTSLTSNIPKFTLLNRLNRGHSTSHKQNHPRKRGIYLSTTEFTQEHCSRSQKTNLKKHYRDKPRSSELKTKAKWSNRLRQGVVEKITLQHYKILQWN